MGGKFSEITCLVPEVSHLAGLVLEIPNFGNYQNRPGTIQSWQGWSLYELWRSYTSAPPPTFRKLHFWSLCYNLQPNGPYV